MFVVLLMMLHPTQELEPPANPGRFIPFDGNRAEELLKWAREVEASFKESLGVQIEIDSRIIQDMDHLAKLYHFGPLVVTEELLIQSELRGLEP